MKNDEQAVVVGFVAILLSFAGVVVFLAVFQMTAALFCVAVCLVSAGRTGLAMATMASRPEEADAEYMRRTSRSVATYAKVTRPPAPVKVPPAELYNAAGDILLPGRLPGALGSGSAATNKTAARLRRRSAERPASMPRPSLLLPPVDFIIDQ